MVGRIIDLSSNNHPGGPPGKGTPINWTLVAAAGVTTAIIKATEGVSYGNPWYGADMTGAQAVGIDTLAYHYAGFTANPMAEVVYFVSHAGVRYARVLDIETSTDVPWIRTFLQGLGLDQDQECTYGSASSLGTIKAQIPGMTWPAAYGQGFPGWGVMWQFTNAAEIPGIVGLTNESGWYGSQIQYDTLFGLYDPEPPQPPEDEDMQLYVTNSTGTGFVIAADLSSKTGVTSGPDAAALLATGQYESVKLSDAQIDAIPNA